MALGFDALISEFYKLQHPLLDGAIRSLLGNQKLRPCEWVEPLTDICCRRKVSVDCQDFDSLSLSLFHADDTVAQRSPDPLNGPQDLVLVSS